MIKEVKRFNKSIISRMIQELVVEFNFAHKCIILKENFLSQFLRTSLREYYSNYSETNFRPGKQDIFNGPATLFECDQFPISDSSNGPVQITLYHEGIYYICTRLTT